MLHADFNNNGVDPVSKLANFKKKNIDWQNHRLTIYGKGGTDVIQQI